MSEINSSETQDTVVPAPYTPPGLVNAPGTHVRREDPFLATPERGLDEEGVSTSFILPSTSFEIKQFTNLHDVGPEWEDEEVDEIMVLSPKLKSRASAVRIVHTRASCELSTLSIPTISVVQPLQVLSSSSAFCKVSLCKSRNSSKLYAVKTFSKSYLFYEAPKLEQAMTEQMMLKLLTQMDVPFVLKMKRSFQDRDALYITTEFCPGGDLRTLIDRSAPLHPTHARFYVAELVDALHSLHVSGIVHRSVAPEHVLIGADGHILLTGFSLASVHGPDSPKAGVPGSSSRFSQPSYTRSVPPEVNEWTAPEVILGWECDFAVDSWGLGMTLYFMLTGKHAYGLALGNDVHRSLVESSILHAPFHITGFEGLISSESYHLLCHTLNRNPSFRLTTEEMQSHQYFVNTDWCRLRAKRYEAPLAVPDYTIDNALADTGELGASESLSGVHITGFDFPTADGASEAEAPRPRTESLQALIETEEDSVTMAPLKPRASSQPAGVGELLGTRPQDDEGEVGNAWRAREGASIGVDEGVASDVATARKAGDFGERAGEDRPQSPSEGGARLLSARFEDVQHGSLASTTTAKSGGSVPSASTALYSCTSFGELREALKAREQLGDQNALLGTDSFGRAGAVTGGLISAPGSAVPGLLGAVSRSAFVSTSVPGSGISGSNPLSASNSQLRPVGIMRKTSTDNAPRNVLGRGLGLRKYASLDFDLDTIISLDADLSNLSARLDTSGDADISRVSDVSYQNSTPPRAARRRVSFVDRPPPQAPVNVNVNSTAIPQSTSTSTPRVTRNTNTHSDDVSATNQFSPSWMSLNFSRYASPAINPNKLKKKRTTSTPVLLNTPHLMEKVDLPAGLEQIGLGIGYTRPTVQDTLKDKDGEKEKEKTKVQDKDKDKEKDRPMDTPRRSVSLGAMVRYGVLFANLARGRTSSSHGKPFDGSLPEEARASEESDAMDAVMREMYGGAWDAELGVGMYGAGAAGRRAGAGSGPPVIGLGSSRRRVAGRVYSVYTPHDEGDMGSTLRLVDPASQEGV